MKHEEVSLTELGNVADVLRRYLAAPELGAAGDVSEDSHLDFEALCRSPAEFRSYVTGRKLSPPVAARLLLLRVEAKLTPPGLERGLTPTDADLLISVAVDIIHHRIPLGPTAASVLSAFAARILIASHERATQSWQRMRTTASSA